jgi:CubicO group peptidase (beta-lactamase class C family)
MRYRFLAVMALLGAAAVARGADGTAGSSNPSEARKVGELREKLVKLMEAARAKAGVPAVGALVVTSKGTMLLEVTGARKAGTDVKIQPADRFHLGSNTKHFTALLIAELVAKKKLTYDLTLAQAFPEYARKMPASFRKVTLRMLLRHRSGMPGDLPDWWKVPQTGSPRKQRQTVVKWAVESGNEVQPEKAFAYSNYGYVMAAAMVERVLNASYESLVKKYVFDPLGIKQYGFGPMTTNKRVIDQPWGHEEDGTPVEPGPKADNPPVMNPAARLHISLGDWAKYAQDQLRGARGEKALLPAAAYKPLHESPNKDESYTLGAWIEARLPFGSLLMHDGSNTLNYAAAVLDPKHDFAILVVCNQGGEKKKGAAACGAIRNALIPALIQMAQPKGDKPAP